jgi:hypothetical protein
MTTEQFVMLARTCRPANGHRNRAYNAPADDRRHDVHVGLCQWFNLRLQDSPTLRTFKLKCVSSNPAVGSFES